MFLGITIDDALLGAMIVVGGAILVVAIISCIVAIMLAFRYIKFNRKKNSAGVTGLDAARKILDDNGLENIKVKCTGSLIFGNSYSHYFHKVRLRRFTYKKDSISSLAMAAQKSSLAIMDKEGDPDMKKRVKLVPLITFGPFMFIPLIIIGVLLDIAIYNGEKPVFTYIVSGIGLLFYVLSFVLSLMTLKTEKKAQAKAYEILSNNGMANEEELDMMKELFHLYNIQYVNDLILEMLELILKVLQFVYNVRNTSSSKK